MPKAKKSKKVETETNRIGKGDLIKKLTSAEMAQSSGFKMTYGEAATVVDAVFSSVVDLLHEHGKINIPGFGTFVITETAARTARNPQNGEPVKVPAKKRLKLRPSVKISEELNKKK